MPYTPPMTPTARARVLTVRPDGSAWGRACRESRRKEPCRRVLAHSHSPSGTRSAAIKRRKTAGLGSAKTRITAPITTPGTVPRTSRRASGPRKAPSRR